MTGRLEKFFEENWKAIVLLMLLISVLGGLAGYRYFKHTREDPEFCGACHLMQESYKSWETSSHRDIICQRCHRMSILEQNRLLVMYVARGYTSPKKQMHGRLEPWRACKDCHIELVKQGSVTLRSSYGHARHVFMEGIDCSKCHSPALHNFKPDERACSTCHTDRLVHGLGMEGLSCLRCHGFGEKTPKMVTSERCRGCHSGVPKAGPMADIQCFRCHKPHGKIKLSSADCLGECHGNEASVGQHGLHMRKAHLGCLDCHKAHAWVVGRKEAARLCVKCHAYRDPRTFIY